MITLAVYPLPVSAHGNLVFAKCETGHVMQPADWLVTDVIYVAPKEGESRYLVIKNKNGPVGLMRKSQFEEFCVPELEEP